MGEHIRAFDWSKTPLGPPKSWPQSLRTMVTVVLGAGSPLAIYWGDDLILLYNDAWRDLIGDKHPDALGRPAREVFPEIWDTLRPMFETVMAGQGSAERCNQLLRLDRGQGLEDTWFDYTFNPILREDGSTGGVFNISTEITDQVLAEERRRETTQQLGALVRRLDARSSELSEAYAELRAARSQVEAERGRYQELFAFAPDGYLVTDVEGVVEEANHVAAELLGLPTDYLVGRPLSVYVSSEDKDAFLDLMDRARRDGGRSRRLEAELVLQPRSRGPFPAAMTVLPVDGAPGESEGLRWMIRDITERKRADEALRRQRELLQAIYDTIPVMLTVYDPDLKEFWFSKHLERVTGWGPEDTAETSIMELAYPDPDYRQEVAEYMQALTGGYRDIEMTTKDGRTIQTIWANVRLADGRRVGIGVDVTERREAQEALRKSEERFRALVTASADAIYRVSPNWTEVRQLHGQGFFSDVEESTPYQVDQHIPREEQPRVSSAINEAVRTKSLFELEHRVVQADGTVGWTHSRAVPLLDAEGEIVEWFGAASDITERKRAEEALSQYAERLHFLQAVDAAILTAPSPEQVAEAVVEQIPRLIPCIRASVATVDQETKELALLAVYSAGEKTDLDKGWRGSLDVMSQPVMERLREGKAHVVEDLTAQSAPSLLMRRLRAEGVRASVSQPIVIHGRFAGVLNVGMSQPGAFSDEQMEVTRELADRLAIALEQARLRDELQRHAGELERLVEERTSALRESETRFRTMFEEAAIGIAITDSRGRVMATNPALQRMLGYTEDELAGCSAFGLLDGAREAGRGLLRAVRRGARSEYTQEVAYCRGNDETGYANLTVSLLRREGKSSPLVMALVEDITERKRAQTMLREAERLTVIGRMGASLAHEINNPLQSVIGCLGLAMEEQEEGGDSGYLMDVAMEELRRAAEIVHRIRDVSRPVEEETELGRVSEVVDKVLAVTKKQAENHDVAVIWDTPGDLPPVPMVRDQVKQVFLNLVLNGIEAMPEGGELRIEAAGTEEPRGVEVSFADTGVGIPPEDLEELFEAFSTNKREGLGLGLYVSRNIVHEHGGWIEVESEVGEGTTFTVWLPLEE